VFSGVSPEFQRLGTRGSVRGALRPQGIGAGPRAFWQMQGFPHPTTDGLSGGRMACKVTRIKRMISTSMARRLCSAVLAILLAGLSPSALVVQASLEAQDCACLKGVCCCGHKHHPVSQTGCIGFEKPARTLRCAHSDSHSALAISTFLPPNPTPLRIAPVASCLPSFASVDPRTGFHRIDSPPPRPNPIA
jgi:hypothetical protein